MSEQTLTVDPTVVLAPDSRLLIDTNVFMDTEARRAGGLKALFERCAPVILANANPIVVPSKVVDELTKQSRLDPSTLTPERAAAVRKAANALVFLQSASGMGLVQKDLGDGTNPYADDLFVELFKAFAGKYQMCLLSFDLTLKMRIRLLAAHTQKRLFVGTVTNDGQLEFDTDQFLFEKAFRKLSRIQLRIKDAVAEPKDHLEVAVLEPLLSEFRTVFAVKEVQVDLRRQAPRRQPSPPDSAAHQQKARAVFSISRKLKPADSIIQVSAIPSSGHPVLLQTSASTQISQFHLGEQLGEGGEGTVFSAEGDNVIKIFDQAHITSHRKDKIELLVESGLSLPGVCIPTGVVMNTSGEFVGYMMPKAHGKEFQRTIFNPRRFKRAFPDWTKTDLVDVCIAFLEKVSHLHSQNILLGDINPKNLMIDDKKRVYVIDADSWQFDGYPCPVGTDPFASPDLLELLYDQRGSYSDRLRTIDDENFAIAVMLFMILITGGFPYTRKGTDGDQASLIREGLFAYQYEQWNDKNQPDGDWKYMWSHIHKPVKDLFWNTFHKDGKRYKRRPSVIEWLSVFKDYKTYLASSENFDPMSNDVYPIRSKAFKRDTPVKDCPNCKRKSAIAGLWNDNRGDYYLPPVCNKCKDSQEKCSDCGKPANQLKDGRCWECNKKRNFAICPGCGKEKPTKYLVGGRCSSCQMVACRDCGTMTPKKQLNYGRCQACTARKDQIDPTKTCDRCGRTFLTYGQIDWFIQKGFDIQKRHKEGDPNCLPGARPTKRTATTQTSRPGSTTTPPAKRSLWQRLFD